MKKLMIIVPHLSTGGLPQYVAKQIEMSCGEYEIWCVEWDSITGGVLVVQRNKIQNLIGTGLVTLGEDKYEFLRLLDDVCPDIIHFQEIPETFIQRTILDDVYKDDRHFNNTPQFLPTIPYKSKSIFPPEKPSQTEHDEIGINTAILNKYYGYKDYGNFKVANQSLPEKNKHKITPKKNIFELL